MSQMECEKRHAFKHACANLFHEYEELQLTNDEYNQLQYYIVNVRGVSFNPVVSGKVSSNYDDGNVIGKKERFFEKSDDKAAYADALVAMIGWTEDAIQSIKNKELIPYIYHCLVNKGDYTEMQEIYGGNYASITNKFSAQIDDVMSDARYEQYLRIQKQLDAAKKRNLKA